MIVDHAAIVGPVRYGWKIERSVDKRDVVDRRRYVILRRSKWGMLIGLRPLIDVGHRRNAHPGGGFQEATAIYHDLPFGEFIAAAHHRYSGLTPDVASLIQACVVHVL